MGMKLEHPPSIQYTGPFRDDGYIIMLGFKMNPSYTYLQYVFFFVSKIVRKWHVVFIPSAPWWV